MSLFIGVSVSSWNLTHRICRPSALTRDNYHELYELYRAAYPATPTKEATS